MDSPGNYSISYDTPVRSGMPTNLISGFAAQNGAANVDGASMRRNQRTGGTRIEEEAKMNGAALGKATQGQRGNGLKGASAV
jgi:hypothetical protein